MTAPNPRDVQVLEYSDAGLPETRLRRFFRRDLPLTLIVIMTVLITTFVLFLTLMGDIDR